MATTGEQALGRRLREVMQMREMSQADVAKRLNTSAAAVSQWLSGAKQPSRENIRTLATLLTVDPQWLEYGAGAGPARDEPKERAEYKERSGWRTRPAPVDGGRDFGNPIVETLAPDLSTLTREALQNVLDQLIDTTARVVFRIIRLRGNELEAFLSAIAWKQLRTHLDSASGLQQRHCRQLKTALDDFDRSNEMLLLVVEEAGTTGLTGDEYGDGNFTALVRNNLDSKKNTATAGGAVGIGKGTWWRTSRFFVVLFNSDLYKPTSEDKRDIRVIGRCELPWHSHVESDTACAGPGWFGHISKRENSSVAESYWGNATLPHDLYMQRDPEIGPGTTIGVLGFYDPSSDDVKDPRALAEDIEIAVAENFWPAIADGKLDVRVETWEGRTLKTQIHVEVSAHQPQFVDAISKMKSSGVTDQLNKVGDVARRQIKLAVPARIAPDGPHPALSSQALLLVRRAGDEDDHERSYQLAMYRGPRMVVEYRSLKHMFPGAVPFHAILLCGEAATDGHDATATKADRFLRAAEPPAHNKWIMTPELKAEYARGGKKAIDAMLNDALRLIGQFVRPASKDLADGPAALKELLNIGDDTKSPERPQIFRPTAMLDSDGRWVVDARVRVRANPEVGWHLQPVVVFDMETGGGLPVEWAELEALSGCSVTDGRLTLCPGVNEARFRGVTNPASHPIAANESAIRIEVRNAREVTEGKS